MSRTSSSVPDPGPIDPADRARLFTVQLRDNASSVRGRLTHVATGETAHFDSGDELVTLLTRVGRPIGA
jgi:hypothetical protein